MKKPFMLMILDGFGIAPPSSGNAIAKAVKPNLDKIFEKYPHTLLSASGLAVGLPEGQMGNSEVGHLNIGAGRIVYQELTRISKAIEDGAFFGNTGGALHIMGLLSDGGVHSHIDHIKATISMAASNRISPIYVHCFMDGRDVPPTSGLGYIQEMEEFLSNIPGASIGVVSGRYYAMDRDKRWDRVRLAYDALAFGQGRKAQSGSEAVKMAYDAGETDEFIIPTVCGQANGVHNGDSIIFCNFRPDRAREITRCFVDDNFDGFERPEKIKGLEYVCMTQYDASMPNVKVAFFNGGIEKPYPLEDRILVPSPKVATYDLQPEMSAFQVTEKVIEEIKSSKYDCIILNFANADMVGHTGKLDAAVKAIEAVDKCVGEIVPAVLNAGGQILLTADHGNADEMLDDQGNPVTSHSLNPVPLVHISSSPAAALAEGGKLCDIAPTMLKLMGIAIPPEMTGNPLV